MNKRKYYLTYAIALSSMLICFYLIRYPLFRLHGMDDWPKLLFYFGLIVIGISFITNSKYVSLSIPLGYVLGFIIGYLFNEDSYDPGGGRLNNMWYIWMITYLACIGTSLIIELIVRIFQKTKHNKYDR